MTSESSPVDCLFIVSFSAVSSDLFFALSRKDKFLIWIPKRSLVILNSLLFSLREINPSQSACPLIFFNQFSPRSSFIIFSPMTPFRSIIVAPSAFFSFKFNGSPKSLPSKLVIFTSSLLNSRTPLRSDMGGISSCGFSRVLPRNSYVPLNGILSKSSKPTLRTSFNSPSPFPSISSDIPFMASFIGLLLTA